MAEQVGRVHQALGRLLRPSAQTMTKRIRWAITLAGRANEGRSSWALPIWRRGHYRGLPVKEPIARALSKKQITKAHIRRFQQLVLSRRRALGLSRKALAGAVGLHPATILNIEGGHSGSSPRSRAKLAHVLGFSWPEDIADF